MKLGFVRSGGFAGIRLAIDLDLEDLPTDDAAQLSALLQAAAMSRLSSTPTVLLGDLNLTPYAPAFRRLVDRSGLKDAFASQAWRPTWQAGFWPLALPLDHVLVPQDSCVVSAQIGADIGSDHRPVLVRLRLD
jgi:endonuclease/exonuclease/phosphatase family metal-dependent hydrolase